MGLHRRFGGDDGPAMDHEPPAARIAFIVLGETAGPIMDIIVSPSALLLGVVLEVAASRYGIEPRAAPGLDEPASSLSHLARACRPLLPERIICDCATYLNACLARWVRPALLSTARLFLSNESNRRSSESLGGHVSFDQDFFQLEGSKVTDDAFEHLLQGLTQLTSLSIRHTAAGPTLGGPR